MAFVRHPVFNSLISVDEGDAITLRTVGEATPTLSKYAQPGSGFYITDEHGTPRSPDEPLGGDETLFYRMDKLDMREAEKAHEELSKTYLSYPQVMGVGFRIQRDARRVPYFLLSIDLDHQHYPDRAIGETLDTPPDGFPACFRHPSYCIPIEYCIASMLYAQHAHCMEHTPFSFRTLPVFS
jgi:hypothetical protein